MNKKTKTLFSIVLSVFIIIIGFVIVINNKPKEGERSSKQLVKAINLIKNEDYKGAYNEVKNSSKKDLEIVQTIILYTLENELTKNEEIVQKISDEAENITDYLTYTYLYSKDDKYQQNIDKIYDEEYSKLYDIKNKITEDIMFNDAKDYYKYYFEYLDLGNGLFKNYESNILNDKDGLTSKLEQIQEKLDDLKKEGTKLDEKYTKDIIPEEYRIILNIK